MCASCSFTNDSTARSCAIELLNDEHKFVFNMSRETKLALLECFPVPEAGVFSVSVYEILQDGSVGEKVWRLPDITVGTVLSLIIVGVIVALLIAIIFIIRRRLFLKMDCSAPEPSNGTYYTYNKLCVHTVYQ